MVFFEPSVDQCKLVFRRFVFVGVSWCFFLRSLDQFEFVFRMLALVGVVL